MGRIRTVNASTYLPKAIVQQYVEANGLNGDSVEAEKASNLSEKRRSEFARVYRVTTCPQPSAITYKLSDH